MIELLKMLAGSLKFFFTDGRYRLVYSEAESSIGDALIEIAADTLRWRLIRDRSQITLECRPAQGDYQDWDWFSTDILIYLLSGRRVNSADLTEEVAAWLQENLYEIEARFGEDRLAQTLHDLEQLEQLREKEQFG